MKFVVTRNSQPKELVSGLVAERLEYRIPGDGPRDDYVPPTTEMRMASTVELNTTAELIHFMSRVAVDFDGVPVKVSICLPHHQFDVQLPHLTIHDALDEL